MPLRFLQTGDWHLGQAYRNVEPVVADRLRAARLEAVGRVLALAEARGAAFVLAAGDQFDGAVPDPELAGALLDRIEAHPAVVVHLIPGNHDPGGPGSVYDRAVFSRVPNLRLHRKAAAVGLPEHGATLYPCPCLARHGDDPLAWIPPRGPGDGLRIGLAHGSLPTFAESGGRNYPIPPDAPTRHDLDYVALGDWHTPTPDPATLPGGRMFYAGAPEVGGWDETAAGFALEVVLDGPAPPTVTAHRVGQFDWIEREAELHGAADVAELAGQLEALAGPTRVVRLRPRGGLTSADRQALDELVAALAPRFAWLECDARDLRPAAEGEPDLPPDPLLRTAYLRLAALAAGSGGEWPGGLPGSVGTPDADVVRLALNRFRALLPEARQG